MDDHRSDNAPSPVEIVDVGQAILDKAKIVGRRIEGRVWRVLAEKPLPMSKSEKAATSSE
jgi:hypothetical protein